ncbi:MAG: hypothetical protein ABSF95_08450 [Verrucomicrobiota bacterium]|jgi:hypothetical protein
MKPRFQLLVSAPKALGPYGSSAEAAGPDANGNLAAMSAERIHGVLRRMSGEDWTQLKRLMDESLTHATKNGDIELLERLFRKGEALGGQAGGTVWQMVQAITGHPPLLEQVRKARERLRERVRFILREMSDEHWEAFKASLHQGLGQPSKGDDIGVVELVLRIGESVSNVETAALALADKLSGRKLLQPEVARKNALVKVMVLGAVKMDPEAAYLAAKQAVEQAEETANRAENTLAYGYVEPTTPYKHARNTVFRVVDSILESQELMAEAARIEEELLAVKPVSRGKMRWALHRMPVGDRMKVIKLIPLNTILMFHEGVGKAQRRDLSFRATRDRRLAYDCFVQGCNDQELMATYGLSANAVKNEFGVILQTLRAKPLARKIVHEYLARVEKVEAMGVDEVRRRMKQLPSERRAEILNGIPNCAWKAREAIYLHKHLFLDYLSGEWVLGALVDYYNLEKAERIAGRFKFEGTLTVRGATAAIAGILHKMAEEPEVRQQLRQWTSAESKAERTTAAAVMEAEEPQVDELMPPEPKPGPRPAPMEAPARFCHAASG